MIFPSSDSEAHLAAIVSSSDDAIISKDLQGYIRSWNAGAERMFGYTAAEAVGQHITIVIPEHLHREEEFVMAEVRQGRVVDHYETVRRAKDGHVLDVSLTVSPIRDSNGQVVGASKIARDVTERRRAEREAFRLAAIVQSSEDAIVSKDLNGIILTWNPGAERMFGYTAEEAIGQSITMIIPEERLSEETMVLSRIRAGIPLEHFETVRQRKDGSTIEISLAVSPIRDRQGRVIGASKIARDISEQKELQRAAAEASRMKDEFLAVLSHELRTPLNTVMGYMRILRREDVAPDLRDKALAAMERNTEALTQLVNDVLDTSRIVTGKLRLQLGTVSVPTIINEAIDTVRAAAEAKGIHVHTFVGLQLELVGDADRLRQVLWNLLSNAVKFTPPGGRITVGAAGESGGVRLTVSDSGIGIDPQDLPRVFQRFWQAESGVTREYGGLGLGLALSRHLVELHGGTIDVRSEGRGRGATFTVHLPRAGMGVTDWSVAKA
jgi:PAS domain S-box-containing protein